MLIRPSRLIAATAALLLTLTSVAGADVLWDQSNFDPLLNGTVDFSTTGSCSPITGNTKVHIANDVHFDTPVHITAVRIYETGGNVQTATQALLWIHPKNGVLPTTVSDSLELAGLTVAITPVAQQIVGTTTIVRVSATGLDIELPAGDYWVSLTPRHNGATDPPYTYHLVTSGPVIGDPSASIIACTSNSSWAYPLDPTSRPDYTMKIEGESHRPTVALPTGQRGDAPSP